VKIKRKFRSPTKKEEERIIEALVTLLTENNEGRSKNNDKPDSQNQAGTQS
jgi:hypothetical protein